MCFAWLGTSSFAVDVGRTRHLGHTVCALHAPGRRRQLRDKDEATTPARWTAPDVEYTNWQAVQVFGFTEWELLDSLVDPRVLPSIPAGGGAPLGF